MGMDVYGKNAKTEVGTYFRRNVWGWRPLWDYCVNQHPEVAGVVKYGHSNDGDGLDGELSLLLGRLLESDIKTGAASAYIENRNAELAELPRPDCDLCSGTGIRTDAIGVQYGMDKQELPDEMKSLTGRTHGTCNACHGEGKTDAWETNYFLELDDIKEFAEFLKDCGGFSIC